MSFHNLAMRSFFMVVLFVSSAIAQLAEDNVGIYFDEAATTNWIEISGPTQVPAYIIITGCTLSNAMVYYWGGVQIVSPYTIQLRGAGTNIHTLIPDSEGIVRMAATFTSPLLVTDRVVVADLLIDVVSDEVIQIFCTNNISYSGFGYEMQGAGTEPWEVVRLWQNTEFSAAPGPLWPWFAACINGAAPVENTVTTWGGIKSLYR